ncbi:hypothetical protein TTRE_0000534301 [Trichuris trichiura]|uniref:Uncharacterized protein n=1 Tax=Trichuris trichiura TaxID=36087 RepID=A0A077ZB34_TRITR|nr:hypothetical protein TTRE_0000534301 [Trichuris trichiura]
MAQNLTDSGDLVLPATEPCTSMSNYLDEENNKNIAATYWENASLQSLLNYGASEIRRLHGIDSFSHEKWSGPSLVSKFKSFSRNRNLPERLEALCLYSSTFFGCEVTPEEHSYLKEDLSDLASTGINIHTLCSALPATLAIFLDDERLSSSNLRKIEEMGQYVYMKHALSTEPFVAEVEYQSEEAVEDGETASESPPAVFYEVLGNTDNDMRNAQSFLEELKEETRLRHEFLWSRAEAVKCRQSLHLLGEFMRPFWFPVVSDGVKSKYALDDTDMKCSVLEPLKKSSSDKTFIMQGPIEMACDRSSKLGFALLADAIAKSHGTVEAPDSVRLLLLFLLEQSVVLGEQEVGSSPPVRYGGSPRPDVTYYDGNRGGRRAIVDESDKRFTGLATRTAEYSLLASMRSSSVVLSGVRIFPLHEAISVSSIASLEERTEFLRSDLCLGKQQYDYPRSEG